MFSSHTALFDKGDSIRYKTCMKRNGASRFILALLSALLLSGCSAPALQTPPNLPTRTSTTASTPTLTAVPQEPASAPTAAPTPAEARLAEADAALQFGDYPAALEAYAKAKSSGSAAQRAAGLYGQGLTYTNLKTNLGTKPLFTGAYRELSDTLPSHQGALCACTNLKI